MRYLIILVLGWACMSEPEVRCCQTCFQMKISDALPVQFWLNGETSFNNDVAARCGIYDICFCQPFNCDDEIKIQVDDELLPLHNGDMSGDASSYSQTNESDSYADWTKSTASVIMNTTYPVNSELLYIANNLEIGTTYTILYKVTGSGTYTAGGGNALSLAIAFYDEDLTLLAGGGATLLSATGSSKVSESSTTITPPTGTVYFGFKVSAATVDSGSYTVTINHFEVLTDDKVFDLEVLDSSGVQLQYLEMTEILTGKHQISFIPTNYGICDEQIRLKIYEDDVEVAASDCLDIRTSHVCTELITYSNTRDFDNIEYDTSPGLDFYLRVPAVFFLERFPEEEELHELSDSDYVRLRNEVKAQRFLELGFMPYYMHRKLKLIFAHDVIEIVVDGTTKTWIRQEPYEIAEGNKHYPLKKAGVWLTDKTYIKRNIL